ncbi:flavin-containing monooxygenase FMO GS-OX-like 9 isoform X1 [Rhododendron vialii]|uniref:flavin-containing monooxygenase FMO GS-OX-like 9 isoform X1 n=1 Tax=Rhododendron vialii TaxID=182163 RepID=UPI00265E5B0D|nr:flavin-containing monooxygenase FMO GS-OX-like 9 isoform X1 [Rhododendron vialii]
MVSDRSQPSKNVCVIGAGPSGLVAARELRKEGHNVVVFEQSHDVGGQWLYDPNVEVEDPLGRETSLSVHSSIYASLRLTSPREIMGFTDFPFLEKKGRDMRRFPGHGELLMYLSDFCAFFGLREMIRFNTKVEYVGMLDYGEFGKDLRWVVRSKEKKCEKMVEEVFDAVVVATGHYSKPRLPSIRGMEAWKRKLMHSHVYRVPEPFRNEVVVVVGNSLSGQDISMELVDVAKDIYLSAKSTDVSVGLSRVISKHENLHLCPQIDSLQEDGRIVFVDGTWVIADTIVYCTGYSYSFPFLDTKGIVVVDDDRVGPLYEHTFPPSLAPSLSFIGIPRKLIGFPFFESQAKWIAQLLSGKRALPSWDEMMNSIKEFYHSRDVAGVPKHNTHDIACFEYCDKYGDNVGFPHLEEWRKELCLSALTNADANLETYRDSYDDHELLQVAHQSPHFTQLEVESIPM